MRTRARARSFRARTRGAHQHQPRSDGSDRRAASSPRVVGARGDTRTLGHSDTRRRCARRDATRRERRDARALRSGVNNPNDGDASKPRPPSSCSAPTLNARLGPRAASRETTRRTRTTMTRARPRRRRSWTRHRRRGTRDVNGKGLARGSSGGGTRDARDAFGSAIALTRFRRRNRANGD